MKILLTGGSGFVGRHFKLRFDGMYSVSDFKRADEVVMDSYDYDVDCLIHCASATPGNANDPCKILLDNVYLANYLSKKAINHQIPMIINLSSMSVYGEKVNGVVTESTPSYGPSLYGLSKLAAEEIFSDCGRKSVTKVVHLRLPGVVGSGSHTNFLSKINSSISANEAFSVFNKNDFFNNVLHVDSLIDFVEIILKNLNLYDEVSAFNLASIDPIRVSELVGIFIDFYKSKSELSYIETVKPSFLIDCQRAMEKGFLPYKTTESVIKFLQ